jgi:hypothetical protein
MASTLSVVSCRICQTHSLFGHTLTHTAMHIDYDRLYAFGYHVLKTGVYIMQAHYVKRDLNQLYCAVGLLLLCIPRNEYSNAFQ